MDPFLLARRQRARDLERTREFDLFEAKRDRLAASPFAFFRGTAPMFYEILAERPELAAGPPGRGRLTGDLHLENFGVFRPELVADDERAGGTPVAFDVNDFDESLEGPLHVDVLRLLVSLLLASRELRVRPTTALALCDTLLEAYGRAATREPGDDAPNPPRCVERLVAGAARRTRVQLLDERTEVVDGTRTRRFVRGRRYRDVPRWLREAGEQAFGRYARKLIERHQVDPAALAVADVAFRVAGTGSLGALRLAVLVRGKGHPDGAWMFDLKEQYAEPAPTVLLGRPEGNPAKRVRAAAEACLARPPRMLGTTKLGARRLLVKRLAPQEDKLDLRSLAEAELAPLAAHLGAVAAAAHRRGATQPLDRPWRAREADALVDHAIELAGLHEAAHLAYFHLDR